MLKFQYFGHLMWRADSLEKTLMLGEIEGRRRGWQRMKWLDGIMDPMDMSVHKLREMVKNRKRGMLRSMGSQSWVRLNNRTTNELTFVRFSLCSSIFLVSVIPRYFVFVVVDGTIFFYHTVFWNFLLIYHRKTIFFFWSLYITGLLEFCFNIWCFRFSDCCICSLLYFSIYVSFLLLVLFVLEVFIVKSFYRMFGSGLMTGIFILPSC